MRGHGRQLETRGALRPSFASGKQPYRDPIFGRADLRSQSECDDVSTFRKAQKYSRETPKQSSTLLPPNSAIRVTSLMRAGQTFQRATQVQTLRLCPNQGWPRHRPDKLANTRRNPAFAQLSIDPPGGGMEQRRSSLQRRMSAFGTKRTS